MDAAVAYSLGVVSVRVFQGALPHPVETLERHFRDGGMTLIQAVFENTFFVTPDAVRERSPYFPGFARKSRTHYPALDKGAAAEWLGRQVKLDDNSRAQLAWAKYSGRPIARGSGYGVRHIWGNPWDPDAFTAGWNLAYMPFWAGMLTEDQHPHPGVQVAIKQASWDLFFRDEPVCAAPSYVSDPGIDLDVLLDGQPLLLALGGSAVQGELGARQTGTDLELTDPTEAVLELRRRMNASWSNLGKAVRALQGLEHVPFGTQNVENSSKSQIRRMMRETGLGLPVLASLIDELAARSPSPS